MTITGSDSVLILGAGVSAPFGLSLGGDLISGVSKAIGKETGALEVMSYLGSIDMLKIFNSPADSNTNFSRFPIHCTMARPLFMESSTYVAAKALNEERKKLVELERLLDGQTSETIDDFIVENPSHAPLTKICIASLFVQACYALEVGSTQVRPFSSRHFPPNLDTSSRNWVHLLINIIRQGIRSGSVSSDNKVKIITFNYDKILEYVLKKQFSNTEASYSHYADYIEIIHVHGECGELEDTLSYNPAEICQQWAEGIHVVHEKNVPKDVVRNRALAKKAIRSANELFFCGFSFSGPNCRLLGLDSLNVSRGNILISYCNYDGNVGVSKTVKKFEKRRVIIEEATGSIERPLGVTDWLMQGHLGELPG